MEALGGRLRGELSPCIKKSCHRPLLRLRQGGDKQLVLGVKIKSLAGILRSYSSKNQWKLTSDFFRGDAEKHQLRDVVEFNVRCAQRSIHGGDLNQTFVDDSKAKTRWAK